MKNIFLTLAAIAGLTFSANAGLQTLNMGTNTVAGSSASNFTAVASPLTLVTTTDATIQVGSTSSGADTSNKTWVFNGSIDNTTWTTNVLAITYASIGANFASGITNIPGGQRYPFYQIFYITNAAASASITNLTGKVFTKTGL